MVYHDGFIYPKHRQSLEEAERKIRARALEIVEEVIMSLVEQHQCDNCGKMETSKEEFGMPVGWYGMRICQQKKRRSDDESNILDAEVCCKECLSAKLEILQDTIRKLS